MTTTEWLETPTTNASTNGQAAISNLMAVGMAQTQGYRSNIEDFYRAGDVQTRGGLTMLLAIVADGIGGNNHGEVAAEMTVKLVFEYVENSTEANASQIPQLLQAALEYANERVFTLARTDKDKAGMGTTAVVTAVCDNLLYFANVGDSRIYLLRQGVNKETKTKQTRLLPVTLDHTWANQMVVQGKLELDKAHNHPKAGELVRSIGYESTVEVDLAFYPDGLATKEGVRQKSQGLKLRSNDRIVLCSDGLIKERHNDKTRPYTTDEEIIHSLTTKKPQQAADFLIKQVDDRQVDDNATVIILEAPGSGRVPIWQQYWQYAAGGGVVLALLLFFVVYGATRPEREIETPTLAVEAVVPIETETVETTETTEADEETLDPATPTIESTIEEVATVGVDESDFAASIGGNNNYTAISANELQINQGDLVVEGRGTAVTIRNEYGATVQLSPEGLVGIRYDRGNQQLVVHCLRGTCLVRGDVSGEAQLAAEQAVTVGSNGTPGTIFPAQYELFAFSTTVPTITPTATATDTPTATATSTHTPPTNTPSPTPSPTPLLDPATPLPIETSISTGVPPTEAPPTEAPPTEAPPTEAPPCVAPNDPPGCKED